MGSEMVRGVGNVGNVSEDVRSKVRAMTHGEIKTLATYCEAGSDDKLFHRIILLAAYFHTQVSPMFPPFGPLLVILTVLSVIKDFSSLCHKSSHCAGS